MQKLITTKKFWAIVAILTIITFLLGLNLKKTFKSEVEVLLLPKNETVSQNINGVLGSAQELTKTLNFYNQLLLEDDGIEDGANELPDPQRKQYWNSRLEINRLGKSNVLSIHAFDASPFQASLLANQTAHTLGDKLSQYYNIRTELEARIIDGPLVSARASIQNIFSVALWSLLIGFFLTSIFFLINWLLGKISFPQRTYAPIRNNPFTTYIPTEPNYPIVEKTEPDYPIVEKNAEPVAKKAAAPYNLPFEDQITFDENPHKSQIFNEVNGIVEKNSSREATPEEVKARLQKLLNGEDEVKDKLNKLLRGEM